MSGMTDLAKRVFELGDIDEDELAVVEDLWQRFVSEYAVGDETVPVRVADYFRGWLTEGNHWEEIPSGLTAKDEETLADPLVPEERRRALLAEIASSHRDCLVCTVIVRVLTAALDTSLRCGDPADSGVEALHRLTTLRDSR